MNRSELRLKRLDEAARGRSTNDVVRMLEARFQARAVKNPEGFADYLAAVGVFREALDKYGRDSQDPELWRAYRRFRKEYPRFFHGRERKQNS